VTPLEPALVADLVAVRFIVFDFDGVFTDNHVYVAQDGTELVRCWRGDGLGLRAVEQIGVHVAVISTEKNPVVTARTRKLGIDCVQGCDDKLAALDELGRRHGVARSETAFVGNDINDRACLEAVRLPIVVNDAHDDVVPLARYRTKALGGRGAVREVCDLFVRYRS
jgi:3-deoxy-D-manno-octulosonate 8-phosphate phosphatase (KDO 8-P phosphatase)